MKLIIAVIKPFKLSELVDATVTNSRFPGMTVFDVRGFGREKTLPHHHERAEDLRDFTDHIACLVASPEDQVDALVDEIRSIAHTGLAGDGKIFVIDLDQAVRIGNGELGELALE